MSKHFKIGKYDIEISMGFSYWGNEPKPVKASWGFEIDIDLHNESKRQYNYDLTKILTAEMKGCWVALNRLNTEVLGYDPDLQILTTHLKEKGLEDQYTVMRYPSHEGIHWH